MYLILVTIIFWILLRYRQYKNKVPKEQRKYNFFYIISVPAILFGIQSYYKTSGKVVNDLPPQSLSSELLSVIYPDVSDST